MSAHQFKVNFQSARQKFFRASNGILGKIGAESSPSVIVSLIESYCVPVLLYSVDSIICNKSVIDKMENAYSQVFSKIFKTYDKNVLKQCQYFMNRLPVELKVVCRKINFLKDIQSSKNELCKLLHNISAKNELLDLCNLYNIPVANVCRYNVKSYMWNVFESRLE